MSKLPDNYISEILKDLKLAGASEQEQGSALAALQDRLDSVIMQTLIALTTPEQKQRLTAALQKNEGIEETVAEMSSQIAGFSEAVEQALLAEYESIRAAMQS